MCCGRTSNSWIVKFNTFGFFPPYGIKAVEFTGAVQASVAGQNKSTDSLDGRNKSEVRNTGSEKIPAR